MADINNYAPQTGRRLKEDSTTVNLVDDLYGKKTDASTIPAGGVGLFGWLSAIWTALTAGILTVKSKLSGVQISTDVAITFANSAAANNQQTVTITAPTTGIGEYMLTCYNPSTVTDLTIKIYAVALALGGAGRDSLLATVYIPKSQTISGTVVNCNSKLIHGIFCAADMKLIVSNDTVLGGADGFSAYVRLREVL